MVYHQKLYSESQAQVIANNAVRATPPKPTRYANGEIAHTPDTVTDDSYGESVDSMFAIMGETDNVQPRYPSTSGYSPQQVTSRADAAGVRRPDPYSQASAAIGPDVGEGPPLRIKTKPMKPSSQKYDRASEANAARGKYYAEKEPFDPGAFPPSNQSFQPMPASGPAHAHYDAGPPYASRKEMVEESTAFGAIAPDPSGDHEAIARDPSGDLDPAAYTNPFDDSFNTAEMSNVPRPSFTSREASAATHHAISRYNNGAAAHTHTRQRAGGAAHSVRTNQHWPVPSGESAHVASVFGENDDMTAGTSGSYERLEQEFAAAKMDAANAVAVHAVHTGRVRPPAGKRQGILKSSSARPSGRTHPWDRDIHGTADGGERGKSMDNDTVFEGLDGEDSTRERPKPDKSSAINRKRFKDRAKEQSRDSESESTVDAPVPTLQDRTQQAWGRKKGTGTGTGSSSGVARSRSAPRPGRNGSSVAFAKDTIHHIERGRNANSDDDTYLSKRSAGTDYTMGTVVSKSYESEVEDLFKDFLFIGDASKAMPGTRRRKENFKKYADDDSTFAGTYGTNGDESTVGGESRTVGTYESDENSLKKNRKRSTRQYADDQTEVTEASHYVQANNQNVCDDNSPLLNVMGLMGYLEGGFNAGITAVSEALGLSEQSNGNDTVTTDAVQSTGPPETVSGLVDYANNLLFGEAEQSAPQGNTELSLGEGDKKRGRKEAGLVELSVCAAKAKHWTVGAIFDEGAEIDVVNDIQFNVITTALPLGVLFQENSAGCWIAKVFNSGNVANAGNGREVEVGDQLASINGNSAIFLTVDEVCDMISSSPNTDAIELTFLRYVGPLHSKPNSLGKNAAAARETSQKKGIFSRRTKSTAPHEDKLRKGKVSVFGRKKK